MTEKMNDRFFPFGEELGELSEEDMAIDWVRRVAAVPNVVLDGYVITEEGVQLSREARKEYNAQFESLPDPTPEESKRRDEEWRAIAQEIHDADPGVIEMNRFLAELIGQSDSSHSSPPIIKMLASLRREAEASDGPMIYINQFMALWAIYKMGQISEQDEPT